jgi:hypothetical protein
MLEEDMERVMVPGQPGQKVFENPSQQKKLSML